MEHITERLREALDEADANQQGLLADAIIEVEMRDLVLAAMLDYLQDNGEVDDLLATFLEEVEDAYYFVFPDENPDLSFLFDETDPSDDEDLREYFEE